MAISFDTLQALFWSITYILIIVYDIKNRALGIPPIAIASNFAWETTALLQDIFVFQSFSWIHVCWFLLDSLIVLFYFIFCKPVYLKHKSYFLILYFFELVIMFFAFFRTSNGMLISSFLIDVIMAIEYFVYSLNKKIIPTILSISFCTTKLLGDMFAWIYYKFNNVVFVVGIIVLLLNIGCLAFVVKRAILENKHTGQ